MKIKNKCLIYGLNTYDKKYDDDFNDNNFTISRYNFDFNNAIYTYYYYYTPNYSIEFKYNPYPNIKFKGW